VPRKWDRPASGALITADKLLTIDDARPLQGQESEVRWHVLATGTASEGSSAWTVLDSRR
jgi:hypothetical protein